jgi:hypothetical protein
MSSERVFFANIDVGTPVQYNGSTYRVGAFSSAPRPANEPPFQSSPEWITHLVVSDSANVASSLAAGRLADINVTPNTALNCTLASKKTQLIVISSADTSKQADRTYTVDLLAYDTTLNFNQQDPTKIANVNELHAQDVSGFDPSPNAPPQTRDARSWRAVSALCEALVANFKPQMQRSADQKS